LLTEEKLFRFVSKEAGERISFIVIFVIITVIVYLLK